MNSPRISILFWSIVELAMGAGLLLIPAQLVGIFGIDDPAEVWIRVLGVALLGVGILYISSTFADSRWFYRATVVDRLVATVGLAYLAVVDGPWQLWMFAIGWLLGAAWTLAALRNTGEGATAGAESVVADTGAIEPQEI